MQARLPRPSLDQRHERQRASDVTSTPYEPSTSRLQTRRNRCLAVRSDLGHLAIIGAIAAAVTTLAVRGIGTLESCGRAQSRRSGTRSPQRLFALKWGSPRVADRPPTVSSVRTAPLTGLIPPAGCLADSTLKVSARELDPADVKSCGSAKATVVLLACDAGLVLIGWVLDEFIWTRSPPGRLRLSVIGVATPRGDVGSRCMSSGRRAASRHLLPGNRTDPSRPHDVREGRTCRVGRGHLVWHAAAHPCLGRGGPCQEDQLEPQRSVRVQATKEALHGLLSRHERPDRSGH